MARAVVILGAGSSADFGVPILANIFKDRHAQRYLQTKAELLGMLNEMFWQPRGYSLESSDQSLNIEQMLTLVKDWEKEEAVPQELKPRNVTNLRRGLYVLIQKAVFEGKSTKGQHLNPLINICGRSFEHSTWVSFNWDCIFEASFWYNQPYYGPGSRANPYLAIDIPNWYAGASKHTFLKLHGGINWWLIDEQVTYLRWTGGGSLKQKWDEYDGNPEMRDRPVILEPSFYKYEATEYRQLFPQWQRFADDLLKAQYVIIVGYSLPEVDINARAKILTGFQVNSDCRWLIINPSEAVCNQYRRLLGRERVTVLQLTLAGFNNEIESHLQSAFPEIDFST